MWNCKQGSTGDEIPLFHATLATLVTRFGSTVRLVALSTLLPSVKKRT